MNKIAIWIRTIGDRALWPCIIGMVLLAVGSNVGVLGGGIYWVAVATWCMLVTTMPLAAMFLFVPGETLVERKSRQRDQARARAILLSFGLTPERYVVTIPAHERMRRAHAAGIFGL